MKIAPVCIKLLVFYGFLTIFKPLNNYNYV